MAHAYGTDTARTFISVDNSVVAIYAHCALRLSHFLRYEQPKANQLDIQVLICSVHRASPTTVVSLLVLLASRTIKVGLCTLT